MSNTAKIAFTFGVFVLLIAMLVPTLISATDSNQTESIELNEGESTAITQRLTVTAQNVSNSGQNATFVAQSEASLNTTEYGLNVTESQTQTLDGENVTIHLRNIQSPTDGSADVATLDVTYSPFFGWNDGATAFWNNLGIIVGMVAFLMVVGLVMVAVKL
jgi:ABC-type oligopeptide transport system substrate-binding subunit